MVAIIFDSAFRVGLFAYGGIMPHVMQAQ